MTRERPEPQPSLNVIMEEVKAELARARARFPSNKLLLHAFAEEAGEVTKAFLDSTDGRSGADQIRIELIQTITVAVRLLQEGDPDFPALPGSDAFIGGPGRPNAVLRDATGHEREMLVPYLDVCFPTTSVILPLRVPMRAYMTADASTLTRAPTREYRFTLRFTKAGLPVYEEVLP